MGGEAGDVTEADSTVPSWDPWGLTISTEDVRYLLCGAEVCPTTKRYHWQGYIELVKAVDLSTVKKILDCNHVHLEPRRGTQEQAVAYCKKEDTGVQDDDSSKLLFEWGEMAQNGVRGQASKNKNYAAVLEMPTYQEAVEKLRELEPSDYVRFHASVKSGLMAHYAKRKVFIRPPESFNTPLISDAILSKRAVVLSGLSGAGKTAYAKAHFKQPLVCSHIDDLKNFNPEENDGIVFDDMSFSHWPMSGCIHILDLEDDRSINCRHTCGVIPAWTKRIFTTNKELYDLFAFPTNEHEEKALSRRIHHVRIELPLFESDA